MKNTLTELGVIRTATLAAACIAGAALPGCRGDRSDEPPRQFFPDLDDQPKWKPQTDTPFFTDGRTMRQPPAGTVAFGRQPFVTSASWGSSYMKQRADLLKDDDRYYLGVNPDGTYLEKLPVPVTPALLARGRERFGIYCYVCHGYAGDGKGMVGSQMQPPPATFHEDKYKRPDPNDSKVQLWKDGYIFHTIRNGVKQTAPPFANTMPPYAHAIDEADAWAIVAYVRVLQASRSGSLQDVPEPLRPDLEKQRPELIAAAEAAAAAANAAAAAAKPPPKPAEEGGKK